MHRCILLMTAICSSQKYSQYAVMLLCIGRQCALLFLYVSQECALLCFCILVRNVHRSVSVY
jgi:hypothetical protein